MHLVLAFYASPKKMQQIETLVNKQLGYQVEGQVRVGVARPTLSRLPFGLYDIRCEKEIAGKILRDLSVNCIQRPKFFWKKSYHGDLDMSNTARADYIIRWGVWVLRKMLRLKYHAPEAGESTVRSQIPGWHYAWLIGAHPDALSPDGREIL